jgi:hypothetical protein
VRDAQDAEFGIGIVLEGKLDMVLDSGEAYKIRRGDVAVQRAIQHQGVNRSETEWTRMMFVLQDYEPVVAGGRCMGRVWGRIRGCLLVRTKFFCKVTNLHRVVTKNMVVVVSISTLNERRRVISGDRAWHSA